MRSPRGSHGYTTTKITATGTAVTGRCVVWWMSVESAAATTVIEISDGTATGTDVWSWGDVVGSSPILNFDPPIQFDTGVYIETLTDITSVTICYSTY